MCIEVEILMLSIAVIWQFLPFPQWQKRLWAFTGGFALCACLCWFFPQPWMAARLEIKEAKQAIAQQPQ